MMNTCTINPLLTDMYQVTMAYAYFKNGRHNDHAVFDLFFRRNPFGGEFTVYAGLQSVIDFVAGYRFTEEQIAYIRSIMPAADEKFFDWLKELNCSEVKIYALREGTIAFPRVPLLRIEGPLAICQLLETTLLNLTGYSSLIATNAARFKLAAGPDVSLLEFGLRRAQGPDGGMTASRCSFIGGFDATSNVLAGMLDDLPVKGTHAHAFVQAFMGFEDIFDWQITTAYGRKVNFQGLVSSVKRDVLKKLNLTSTNEGELAAFAAYALAFPKGFLALVDSYDTLRSGIPNFLIVAEALAECGYKAIGIRLDSGDLAYLSRAAKTMLKQFNDDYIVVASNDITEETLLSLRQQGHQIDVFGIGTHLVTCQLQPALGCVYKLVEINGQARIKLSEDAGKITLPYRKNAYRLYGEDGKAILDLLLAEDDLEPTVGDRILCCHPVDPHKQVYVRPTKVEKLHQLMWPREQALPPIGEIRSFVQKQLRQMREDHLRPLNPTPYKVSVSKMLFDQIHQVWSTEASIPELR